MTQPFQKTFTEKQKLILKNFVKKQKNFNNLVILRLFNIIGLTKNFKPKNFQNFKNQRLLFKLFRSIKKNFQSILGTFLKNQINLLFRREIF